MCLEIQIHNTICDSCMQCLLQLCSTGAISYIMQPRCVIAELFSLCKHALRCLHLRTYDCSWSLFFSGTGVGTHDLMLARQALYHLSHSSSPCLFLSDVWLMAFLEALTWALWTFPISCVSSSTSLGLITICADDSLIVQPVLPQTHVAYVQEVYKCIV
jgi:hypothetical protein